jgi:hypothetical protein
MTLDELVNDLSSLPHAEVGLGPHHSREPNSALEAEFSDVCLRFPFLCEAYPDYVAFLDRYGGGDISLRGGADTILWIYGLGQWNDLFATPLTADEFYCFALWRNPSNDDDEVSYAFNARRGREMGVYETRNAVSFEYYCGSFVEWLERIIARAKKL